MKKFLIFIILISGCSSSKNESRTNVSDISFNDNLSIEEFQNRLNEYAQNSPYPNIEE
tara:strand:- start:1476 stop:1649 length:174 start_codon:yes stop_codon:yes gene_type:complete